MRYLALAAPLLLLAGCAGPEPTIACEVKTDLRHGRGVIVGPSFALTVDHVCWDVDEVLIDGRRHARVKGRSLHRLDEAEAEGRDGLVLLELEPGQEPFPSSRIATVREQPPASGEGLIYLSKDGSVRRWPFGIEPGDSGSPILDCNGRVVGLVRAVRGEWEGVSKARELSRLNSRE